MKAATAAWTLILTGGSGVLLLLCAVVILEISCGVSLILRKHVETPYRTEGAGSAIDLIGLLRHIFVLVPLTVFLAYAAWMVEAAAILIASGIVGAYYTILQYIWPQASVLACAVLGVSVYVSYDAKFKRQFLSRVYKRFFARSR